MGERNERLWSMSCCQLEMKRSKERVKGKNPSGWEVLEMGESVISRGEDSLLMK